MKRVSVVLVVVSTVGLAACQQIAPERTADAADPAGAPPPAGSPAESRPAPPAEPVASPAQSAPQRPAPSRPAEAPAPPERPEAAVAPPAEAPQPALTSSPAPEPRILATLAEDVSVEGRVILAAGTEVLGHVTAATQSGRVKGRARLAMEFDEVRDGGSSYRIDATPVDVTAESSKGKDAKIAGGAAAAGAIIGAIRGGGKGALKGGAIGGAAGGAAVLATRGKEVVLESGTGLEVTVNRKVQID